MSSLFKGYHFALELDFSFRYKQKQELKKKITNNGGVISYALTKETNFLIVSSINQANTTYKGRTAQKNGTPIVTILFISRCVKEGRVVDPTAYLANGSKQLAGFERGKIQVKNPLKKSATAKSSTFNLKAFPVWTWGDNKAPDFNEDSYEVAKSCLLLKSSRSNDGDLFYQLELHVLPLASQASENEENKYLYRFRVFCHYGNCKEIKNESSGEREFRYLTSSSDALNVYSQLYRIMTFPDKGYKKCNKFISRWIGSDKQRKISLESSYESGATSIEVVDLVEHIWQEANEQIKGMLSLPEETMKKEQVDKAESTLLQIRHELDSRQRKTELDSLSKQLFEILPLQKGRTSTIEDRSMLSKMHDICQLLKDMVSVSEATDFLARSSIESKFRALRCHIEHLPSSAPEYKQILNLVKSNNESRNNFDIRNIFAVSRSIEETNFTHRLGNKKLLFHASNPANFVGIFTRGLLLPKIVVSDFGGKRRDPGNLGSGIYFTDSSSTSAKYSSRSTVKGSRFMLVNEVALGKCLDMTTKNYKLSSAPEGYNSVHAVKRAVGKKSVFEDNEYVVYNACQQRIRYLIEFALPEDKIINFIQKSLKETLNEIDDSQMMDISIADIQSLQDPLDKVQAGLQSKDNCSVPLTAVHIRAKLIDLAAQVVVLQAYRNENSCAIEAKYVFPLDDMAAVCGFEAFIDGKHIVGEVKDKEVAHREYREAISKGHGAYLMDEETPDVFTVSVGNLPPNSEVLIKITYVAELAVDCGNIVFNLPGSVAPWKKDGALSVKTQAELLTKKISGLPGNLKTSIQIAVEMPYDIRSIDSPTHDIKIKHATTKATVEVDEELSLDDGFQLLIELAEMHVPRMWVERHPEKVDSQACMLTFYPEFESESSKLPEILLVLDLSNSMKGENLLQAKKILLMILECLPTHATFNIITFGTNFDELYPASHPKTVTSVSTARTFIRNVKANMGNTEVWRPLHAYFLLSDTNCLRNIFLISDGHINNEESTLNAIQHGAKNNRVFTFGISKTANKHLLRAIARVGTGAFEFFDTARKSKWARKVKSQLLKARQPALSNVSVEWQQSDDNASKPIQAPGQITSLFSGSRQVVYGYVPFCRQATLKAEINGDEISTMVYTNELSVTRGKILHQLTARAIIRDWEDGTLDVNPVEHDVKKDAQKSYIIDLSKEYSIVTQFTSFIAVEERDKTDFVGAVFKPSINDLVANEDVDDLPYVCWEDTVYSNFEICSLSVETPPPVHGRYEGDYIISNSEDSSIIWIGGLRMGQTNSSSSVGRSSTIEVVARSPKPKLKNVFIQLKAEDQYCSSKSQETKARFPDFKKSVKKGRGKSSGQLEIYYEAKMPSRKSKVSFGRPSFINDSDILPPMPMLSMKDGESVVARSAKPTKRFVEKKARGRGKSSGKLEFCHEAKMPRERSSKTKVNLRSLELECIVARSPKPTPKRFFMKEKAGASRKSKISFDRLSFINDSALSRPLSDLSMKDEENDSDILPPMHMLSMKDGESDSAMAQPTRMRSFEEEDNDADEPNHSAFLWRARDSAMAQPTRMRSFEEEDNDADEPNHSAFFWRARDSARARPTRMRSFGKEENRKPELFKKRIKGTPFPRPLLKQQMQSASIPPPPSPPPGRSYAFPSADVPAYDIPGPDLALQQTRKPAPPPASSIPLTQYRSASPNFSASAYPTLNQVEPVRNSAFRESVSPHCQETFDSCDNISFEYMGPGCASLGGTGNDILCDMLSRGSSSPQLGANAFKRTKKKKNLKSDKKRVHYDMLLLYTDSNFKRETGLYRYLGGSTRADDDVYILPENCKHICVALKRAINKQNPDGSWSFSSIQELTRLDNIIAGRNRPVFLCTAVVASLLELVLLNWKRICKALYKFQVNSFYEKAFNCLMEAESFLQSKSFSDVPKLSTEGQDNWLEYVEIQILHASVPTDLGVNSSLIVVPEKLISFEQRMKVLKKSQLWLKKPFWTVSSASFSVLFGIRRRKIVALLKQSGIKELDLKIQEEVHSMLALAIGIRSMSAHNIDDGVTSTMVETVQSWLHEKETANPGLASQLKLGGDWLDVASKMCK